MKISIQAVNFSSRQQLNKWIEKKTRKLKRLYDNVIGIDIKLTLDRQVQEINKRCDMRLVVPGYDMFSNTRCDSFEEAVAKAVEALEKQIQKRKTKIRRKLAVVPILAQAE